MKKHGTLKKVIVTLCIILLLLLLAGYMAFRIYFGGTKTQHQDYQQGKTMTMEQAAKEEKAGDTSVSTVYYTDDISSDGLLKIYDALGVDLKGKVGVKLSFGEKGDTYYLDPQLIKPLVQKVNGTFIECNTAYGGSRTSTAEHLQVAKDHVEEHKAEDTLITMMGIVYVIFFSFHIVLVDQTGPYSILIWTVILAAAGTDIFAYFIGSALGKHKLCPHLSPKKSIEGAIGGVIGSVALCALFAYLFAPYLMLHFVLIGLIGSPFAQCGDLAASAYKRKMGIKDYSNLIPGHGGIMDRIDSMLFMAPFVFYYIQLVLVR
jgi:CDP-diglyceride synthetase